jgi:hypothetical protein
MLQSKQYPQKAVFQNKLCTNDSAEVKNLKSETRQPALTSRMQPQFLKQLGNEIYTELKIRSGNNAHHLGIY